MPHPGHQTFHPVNVLKEETVVFHHSGDAFGFGSLGDGRGQAAARRSATCSKPVVARRGRGCRRSRRGGCWGRSQQKRQLQLLCNPLHFILHVVRQEIGSDGYNSRRLSPALACLSQLSCIIFPGYAARREDVHELNGVRAQLLGLGNAVHLRHGAACETLLKAPGTDCQLHKTALFCAYFRFFYHYTGSQSACKATNIAFFNTKLLAFNQRG